MTIERQEEIRQQLEERGTGEGTGTRPGGSLECMDYGKKEKQHIRLLDGKNACPPNDVGGIYGYKEMLKIIKDDPDSEEAWEYYTWLGSKWDEKFFPAIDTAIALNEFNYKT